MCRSGRRETFDVPLVSYGLIPLRLASVGPVETSRSGVLVRQYRLHSQRKYDAAAADEHTSKESKARSEHKRQRQPGDGEESYDTQQHEIRLRDANKGRRITWSICAERNPEETRRLTRGDGRLSVTSTGDRSDCNPRRLVPTIRRVCSTMRRTPQPDTEVSDSGSVQPTPGGLQRIFLRLPVPKAAGPC